MTLITVSSSTKSMSSFVIAGNSSNMAGEYTGWVQPLVSWQQFITKGATVLDGVYFLPLTHRAILENFLDAEEDAILVSSGVLPKLVEQAMRSPASADWERELDEL